MARSVWQRARRAVACDDGVVGGAEALAFGLLTFVIGALLIANAWAVIDAKIAASSAAREAARAYVEAPDAAAAEAGALAAAIQAAAAHGRDPSRLQLEQAGVFARCQRITMTATYPVPVISLPWIGGLSGPTIDARAVHSEIVDPFRTGLDVDVPLGADCG